MSTETPKKTGPPQIVMLDRGFKLAESWVEKMSKIADDEPTEVETEKRPSRLGLGAKVSRHSKYVPSDNPVERKLHAKLNAGKRKAAESAKESTLPSKDVFSSDDDEENILESRTSAFSKKRAIPVPSLLQSKKKQK